jgi:hypothetical protein
MTYRAPDIDQISVLAILLKSPFPVPGSLPVTAEGKCKIRFLTNPKHTSMIARISHEIIASTKWRRHKSVKQWKVTRTDIQANSRWPCTDRRKPAELIERLRERVRYQPGGYIYVCLWPWIAMYLNTGRMDELSVATQWAIDSAKLCVWKYYSRPSQIALPALIALPRRLPPVSPDRQKSHTNLPIPCKLHNAHTK